MFGTAACPVHRLHGHRVPGGDEAELYRSLKRLLKLEKDYIVCPGHGEPTSIFQERELYCR